MGDAPTGRAGMDVRHLRNGTTGTRADRRALLKEAMRELDPRDVAKQAARNPNIIAGLAHTNMPMVNDGAGGFRRPRSVVEVLDYGDARQDLIYRKISPKSFVTTTIVSHLPKTMCREVFYVRSDGEKATRWVAQDPAEMRRYFDELVTYLGDRVLPGGQAAIHGYDINLDETTPHIQVFADTFGDDPKHDGALRVMASQAWTSHRDVLDDQGRQKSGPAKMREYHRGLRELMLARGFEVEKDIDPERSRESLDKPTYIALDNRKKKLDALVAVADKDADNAFRDRKEARNELHAASLERVQLKKQAKALRDREEDLEERSRKAAEVEHGLQNLKVQLDAERARLQRAEDAIRGHANEAEAELCAIIDAARRVSPLRHDDENLPHEVWQYFSKNPKAAEHFDRVMLAETSIAHASRGPKGATILGARTEDPFEPHRARLARTKRRLQADLADADRIVEITPGAAHLP